MQCVLVCLETCSDISAWCFSTTVWFLWWRWISGWLNLFCALASV